ncbi:FAD-binding oxidoreductase [Rhodococcus sp. T7]|uniref:FAD-binding oxidoreductase n=1 Tax=Rhodococcus sp. T7 TaxID=627444 RepID=UPI00135AF2BA|nr:FAD-binding oxidoreductase [Rhodococcus sp. T7]KAF0962201.1 putative FAD-linked oxidoreductase [Rhodococcus sp. T7]
MDSLCAALAEVVGERFVTVDADVLAARATDHTGRYRGRASALVRPADAAEVSAVLGICRRTGMKVTVQGGRTGLEAGTVPEHDDVLLSTERLTAVGAVDRENLRVTVGAGVTLAAVGRAASGAGLLFGVDLASRDSATIGGMVSTNAGGLHTVRYGHMSAQVLGLEVVLPDGAIVRRSMRVGAENCGYDLPALWVGSEGTLGVVTAVDLALHPVPDFRVTALAGFAHLSGLIDAAHVVRRLDGVDAVEMLDGRGLDLASSRLGFAVPTGLPWYLLVELAGHRDLTVDLADALERCDPDDEPAVGIDLAGRARVWAARDAFADVVGLFGPPLKFDAAVPLDALAAFVADAVALVANRAPDAIPILFGHVADGNVHLNVLRCPDESVLYRAVTELIRDHGGNIASEHGVGAHKRNYLDLALSREDIAAMWTIKRAFDPDDYLNPAVMFPDWLRPPR